MNAGDVLRIFDACGTDKGRHGYASFYAGIPTPGTLLEIGVESGNSLMAWRLMWPEAMIYGVDNKLWHYQPPKDDRVQVFENDATKDDLGLENLDLIIDDGSHLLADQIAARDRLFPCLSEGGIYVIEDVTPENSEGLLLPGWSLLVTGPTYDDRLVIWWGDA